MVKADIKVEKFNISRRTVDIEVCFFPHGEVASPRVAVIFDCGIADRRIPMKVEIIDGVVKATGSYEAPYIFYGLKLTQSIRTSFIFTDGTDNGERFDTDFVIPKISKTPIRHFIKSSWREKKKDLVSLGMNILSLPFRILPVKDNRVSFFSNRTDTPTGNIKAAYETIKDIDELDVNIVCKGGGAKGAAGVLFKFLHLYMTSKVFFVDDYYHLISYVKKKDETKLIQLWHACGAFKTFGFSRFHKDSSLELYSSNHRQYDFAMVSSPEVATYYAEAFGISESKAVAIGSPRCDILSDENYKKEICDKFYTKYPQAKGKKLLLFAPTFRGAGNGDCYYPMEKFDVDKVLETLGDDWAVIIKLHPYLTEQFTCSDKNKDRMIECSQWDVNDILFVTDFLVTDYSSVIFEASILDIPMVFYTYDLEEFIESRDFYYDFKSFVPGPIVRTDVEAAIVAREGLGDLQKVRAFKQRAFGDTTGNACKNLKKLTLQILKA